MQDIAISVGATYYSEKTGDDLSHINFGDLGHAAKVIVGSESTVIIKSDIRAKQDKIEERVSQLWEAHKIANKKADKDFILERIASLTGGIGVIHVGGNTDLEQKELYDRVDDAVCAVRSALEEGIVPGAGKALYDINVNDLGLDLNTRETSVALMIMAQIVYGGIIHKGVGYNLKTGEVGNLIEMGVIDPLKVTRSALENAVSVAVTILSTNAIVTMARSYENA
jgi:chaperonin GroEL